jgi:hypothetical protein
VNKGRLRPEFGLGASLLLFLVQEREYDFEMLTLKAVVATVICCGGLVLAQTTQATESYAVYSVLIPQIQTLPQTKFVIAAKTVPYADTKVRFAVEPENAVTSEEFDGRLSSGTPTERTEALKHKPCTVIPEAERMAYLSAMRDYRRKNEVSISLEPRFQLPRPYEVVTVGELDRDGKMELAGANGAIGIYELSAVGFSSDMTIAIVYVGLDCPRCGRWALHILKKTSGKWYEVAEGCNWLS